MAKIVRYNGNLQAFASAAPGTERTIFGDVTQANDLTSQITADFLRGWGIVGPSDQPALEDFNGAMYTHGQLLAYLHQMGVAEYNATQEYHLGSISSSDGSLYVSRINTNTGNTPATSPASWRDLDVAPPNVGHALNARASILTASASATFTADEIVLKQSLGGKSFALASFSKVINLATTGLGGMDTGVAPVSGWVAVYAIYNPTTGVSGLLGKNATLALQTETYTGANAPAGFTASALVAVLPTTAASIFAVAQLFGRHVSYFNNFFSGTVASIAAFTLTSIAGAVPINAKSFNPNVGHTPSGAGNNSAAIAPTSGGIGSPGYSTTAGYVGIAGAGVLAAQFAPVPLITAQTTYIAAGGTGSVAFNSYGYDF